MAEKAEKRSWTEILTFASKSPNHEMSFIRMKQRGRESERERVCVCVRVWERKLRRSLEQQCACVGVQERKRERKRERLKLVLRGTASDVTSWGDHTGHEENRLSWHLFKRWKVVSELLQRASLARVMALSRPSETSLKISQRQKKTLVVIRT